MTCMTPQLLVMHMVFGALEVASVLVCTAGIVYLVWKHVKAERAASRLRTLEKK